MGDVRKYTDGQSSSQPEGPQVVVPKPEIEDFEMPPETVCSRHIGENVASSSGSNLRSFLIGMGFLTSLVDKVIEEKGEDDADLLVETLIRYSDAPKSNSELSDSLDSLFDEKDTSSLPEISSVPQPKEEPDIIDQDIHDKRASLLMMNFSVNEVEFALNKLGADAPFHEIVDFIAAAQIAENFENETEEEPDSWQEKIEESTNEALFGTMEKTLRLLEMGFTEHEVSLVIEKLGSEVPMSELADSIFTGRMIGFSSEWKKYSSRMGTKDSQKHYSDIKTEDFNTNAVSHSNGIHLKQTYKGKRVKEEYDDGHLNAVSHSRHREFKENNRGKRPKQEPIDNSTSFLDPTWTEEKPDTLGFGMSNTFKSSSCRRLDKMIAKPPYFFYGNVVSVSRDDWIKMSNFLYAIEPEFVNTQFFSALSRKEGYIHNLPSDNRFHILPKPLMTIEDAIPQKKRWWPSWDTRKQISCIVSDTSEISKLCGVLEKKLIDSRGLLSSEQQRYILHSCQTSNLVWTGPYKLGPVEPEHLEHILGYPVNHTRSTEMSLAERLQLLEHCFQTDTLGYHLSVLKSLFPGGLTVLSIFSGIGGAEVALHRLGIHLKRVVSIETSEVKQRILKSWWHSSGQTGELVQISDIQSLTINRLESLMEKFGTFDFIICQNPCSQSKGSSKMAASGDRSPSLDFSLYYESVRVIQRVRDSTERKR